MRTNIISLNSVALPSWQTPIVGEHGFQTAKPSTDGTYLWDNANAWNNDDAWNWLK